MKRLTLTALLFAVAVGVWFTFAARAQVLPPTETNTCPAPQTRVEVNTRVVPVMLLTDLTFAQIAALAQRNGQRLPHPPYGFYLGRVWYNLEIHEVSAKAPSCTPEFKVTTEIALIERRIEIASDLKSNTCLYQTALEHYQKHAEADERAFTEFAATILERIQAALAGIASNGSAKKDAVGQRLGTAFESVLSKLDRDREDAKGAVDSPSEVDRVSHPACQAQGA